MKDWKDVDDLINNRVRTNNGQVYFEPAGIKEDIIKLLERAENEGYERGLKESERIRLMKLVEDL